jgi:hypothetical protein
VAGVTQLEVDKSQIFPSLHSPKQLLFSSQIFQITANFQFIFKLSQLTSTLFKTDAISFHLTKERIFHQVKTISIPEDKYIHATNSDVRINIFFIII